MAVRCKFAVVEKSTSQWSGSEKTWGVKMRPVSSGSPENKDFFKATPSGEITFSTINDAGASQLELGEEYYVDISPAEQPE